MGVKSRSQSFSLVVPPKKKYRNIISQLWKGPAQCAPQGAASLRNVSENEVSPSLWL